MVAESVQRLADAVDRTSQPKLPPASPAKRLPEPKNGEQTLFDAVEPPEEAPDVGESVAEPNVGSVPARKPRGQGEKRDRNAGIVPVGDVDWVQKGKDSLKDFFASKAPQSDLEQVLVICYYLQHTADLAAFGAGHVMSGFKHVGKPIPKDLKRTIRNAATDKTWLNVADMEKLRTTTEGENYVEHELGQPKGD